MNSQKTLSIPFDIEAEQAVLGSIIEDNDQLIHAEKWLSPASFYKPAHQHIYRVIEDLAKERIPFDEVTLGDRLKKSGNLDDCGGYMYIAELVDCIPAAGNIEYWARIIGEHAQARSAIQIFTEGSQAARDPSQNISELIEGISHKIAALTAESDHRGSWLKEALGIGFRDLQKKSENTDDVTGIPTGFIDLDRFTSGLQNSDLIIIAARPGMGKTAFAVNIATHAATVKPQGVGLIFSLEMSKKQLALRSVAAEGKIDTIKFLNGNLDQEDWDRMARATNKLSGLSIIIEDTPGISIIRMLSVINFYNRTVPGGVKWVIVDYLQLMSGDKSVPREQQIAEITRGLKGIAKTLDIPVVALSQLNRTMENRADKHPQLSDLRESGAIEQDADIVLFIYRDEVYNPDSPDKGVAEVIIAKHRNGPLGLIRLAFIGKYTRFGNLSRLVGSEPPPNRAPLKTVNAEQHWQDIN